MLIDAHALQDRVKKGLLRVAVQCAVQKVGVGVWGYSIHASLCCSGRPVEVLQQWQDVHPDRIASMLEEVAQYSNRFSRGQFCY